MSGPPQRNSTQSFGYQLLEKHQQAAALKLESATAVWDNVHRILYPEDPRYIYLHHWLMFMVNAGEYLPYMDPMV